MAVTGHQPVASGGETRRQRWPLLRALAGFVVLGAFVGVLVFLDARDDSPRETAGSDAAVGKPALVLGPLSSAEPRVGEPAPDFALRDPEGRVHRLSDYRGQVVWLNFWATWCTPCQQEMPDIQSFYDRHKNDGLVVLAINLQETGKRASDFVEARNLTFPVLLDRDGKVFENYKLPGLPDSVFIDRDGIVRVIHWGFLTTGQMASRLQEVGLP
jgi:peroxiredoxin